MAKLIKLQSMELPKVYVVGKEIKVKMQDIMGGNNPIPALWEKCMSDDTFQELSKQKAHSTGDWVGLMTDWDEANGTFDYTCGMMLVDGVAPAPEYSVHELAATKVWASWVQGKDINDVCKEAHCLTAKALAEQGVNIQESSNGWCMEVYNCPRFTVPDSSGNIILDYYIAVK